MPRATPGGLVYHVLNRANAGLKIFRTKAEYAAFEQALAEAVARVPVRLLAYCLMPDHWHLVVWPRREHDLSEFMRWLTVTHTRRWHARRHVSGTGHLYQGRYRSFPVEPGESLMVVCRYVESNAKRSGSVRRAEEWPWSSLARRQPGGQPERAERPDRDEAEDGDAVEPLVLDAGPTDLPRNWAAVVNAPIGAEDLTALRNSVQRGAPFGSPAWRVKIAKRLGLQYTMRPRGRPRKTPLPEPAVPAPAMPQKKGATAGVNGRRGAGASRRAKAPAGIS